MGVSTRPHGSCQARGRMVKGGGVIGCMVTSASQQRYLSPLPPPPKLQYWIRTHTSASRSSCTLNLDSESNSCLMTPRWTASLHNALEGGEVEDAHQWLSPSHVRARRVRSTIAGEASTGAEGRHGHEHPATAVREHDHEASHAGAEHAVRVLHVGHQVGQQGNHLGVGAPE